MEAGEMRDVFARLDLVNVQRDMDTDAQAITTRRTYVCMYLCIHASFNLPSSDAEIGRKELVEATRAFKSDTPEVCRDAMLTIPY